MLQLISQDLKATARRTLEEILPGGDATALAEVIHPNFVDHHGPPARPRGWTAWPGPCERSKQRSRTGAGRSTRPSPKTTPWSCSAPSMAATPANSWAWPQPAGPFTQYILAEDAIRPGVVVHVLAEPVRTDTGIRLCRPAEGHTGAWTLTDVEVDKQLRFRWADLTHPVVASLVALVCGFAAVALA